MSLCSFKRLFMTANSLLSYVNDFWCMNCSLNMYYIIASPSHPATGDQAVLPTPQRGQPPTVLGSGGRGGYVCEQEFSIFFIPSRWAVTPYRAGRQNWGPRTKHSRLPWVGCVLGATSALSKFHSRRQPKSPSVQQEWKLSLPPPIQSYWRKGEASVSCRWCGERNERSVGQFGQTLLLYVLMGCKRVNLTQYYTILQTSKPLYWYNSPTWNPGLPLWWYWA